jgi:GT2 family glycosyltransferase
MISKLKNNKKIGVVGPLTNNIGNEAKLDVQYKDMHEMKKIAFDNTIFNRGNYTELNMVAYFAVMFRKIDFEKFGPLSEEYGVGMFEDDDHCAMIKSKGNICVLAEDAFIHHELSASFSKINEKVRKKNFEKNKLIYEKKWGVWIPHQYRTNSSINSLNEYSKIRVTK